MKDEYDENNLYVESHYTNDNEINIVSPSHLSYDTLNVINSNDTIDTTLSQYVFPSMLLGDFYSFVFILFLIWNSAIFRPYLYKCLKYYIPNIWCIYSEYVT